MDYDYSRYTIQVGGKQLFQGSNNLYHEQVSWWE